MGIADYANFSLHSLRNSDMKSRGVSHVAQAVPIYFPAIAEEPRTSAQSRVCIIFLYLTHCMFV